MPSFETKRKQKTSKKMFTNQNKKKSPRTQPKSKLLKQAHEKWKRLVPIVLGFLGIVGGIINFRNDIGDLVDLLGVFRIHTSNNSYFSGSVINELGEPLVGVQLVVEGNLGADSTSASGNFKFNVKAPSGNRIRLLCTKPGYKPYDDYYILPGPAKIILKKEN